MSMPHEQACQRPAKGYARYVGRVGALAVGLGIGAAIAANSGIAHADDNESGSPSGSSASSKSTGAPDGPSSKKSPDGDHQQSRAKPDAKKPEKDAKDVGEECRNERRPGRGLRRQFLRCRRGTHADGCQGRGGGAEEAQADARRDGGCGTNCPTDPAPGSHARRASFGWGAVRPVDEAPTVETASALTRTAAAPTITSTSLVQPTVSINATSPLATPQQLAAERLATQTADTLPVALMKLLLQFGFRSAAQQQFAQVGGPDQGNLGQLTAAVDEYAMGAAFQQQILNSNDPTVVMQVAPPHTWYGQTVPGSRILYDNPDTIYRFMGVNAASSYVITGQFTGDRPADTTFSVLTGLSGNTASVLSGHDLVVNSGRQLHHHGQPRRRRPWSDQSPSADQ